MTNRFNIGDTLYTYDMHYDNFIQFKVESIKKRSDGITYNGVYLDEDCANNLSDAKNKWLDYMTSEYNKAVKRVMDKYYEKEEELKNA